MKYNCGVALGFTSQATSCPDAGGSWSHTDPERRQCRHYSGLDALLPPRVLHWVRYTQVPSGQPYKKLRNG